MARDLEIALLRSFVTAVAARLILPALSQQLRKLESAVGRPLLYRSPSGVSLTRAGEELLPYAERILALSAQALTETGRALTGHCGVGLLEDLAASQLPQALADLARLHPGATLEVLILPDRKSTRLNSSHVEISYAVFCLKKKKVGLNEQAPYYFASADSTS